MTSPSGKADQESRTQALLEATRDVEHWYYERDAMWVTLRRDELEKADAAVLQLHNVLVDLGESGAIDDI